MTKPRRRWIRRLVIAVVAIELFWLVGVNLFLNTGLAPWAINRKPEKWTVAWESVWTPFPARINVKNFRFEQKNPRTQVVVGAEQIVTSVKLLRLATKTLRANGVRVEGLTIELDRDPDAPKAVRKKKKSGFLIDLRDIEVERIDSFRFNQAALKDGESSVTADFKFRIRGDLSVSDALLTWQDAHIDIGDQVLAESLSLGYDGDLLPFNPKEDKGLVVLERFSGTLDVKGSAQSLVPLQVLFAGTKWVERVDGSGEVDIHLITNDGTLMPESRLAVEAEELRLDFLGFSAGGTGTVVGNVETTDSGDVATAALAFDDFHFGRQEESGRLAAGTGLRLAVNGPTDALETGSLVLDLPESEVMDLSVLSQSLPPGLGLEVTGGEASLSLHVEAVGAEEETSGQIELRGERLAGRFRDFDFETDLELVSKLSGEDWDDFEVELEGTSFKLSDGRFDHDQVEVEPGWWMTIDVPRGRANMQKPLEAAVEVDLSMRDTAPLVALFAEMKSFIGRFDGILTVRDVEGHAEATLARQRLSLRALSLEGDKLAAEGELELEKGDSNGIFWAKYRALGFAIERVGEETDWKMYKAREWFDEQRAESWTTSDEVTDDGGSASDSEAAAQNE